MAKIIVRWQPQISGSACKFDVYMMNTYIGQLRNGEALEFTAEVGSYTLFFRQKSIFAKKSDTTFVAVVNYESEVVELRAKFAMNGNFEVRYADNAPHIPTYDKNAADNTIVPNVNAAYVTSKIDSEKKQKKMKGCLVVLLTVFIIFLICIILAIIFSESSDTSGNTTTQTVSTQDIEVENEEKSKTELQKATEKFAKGDYERALAICDKIQTEYPNTTAAVDMDNYINEQYKQYPSLTANQLMSEYESNVVNADKQYTGKTMIVSGVINSFGKTNHDNNLCVLLNSGEYFKAVQLNFNVSQTDAVAELKDGMSIKVIGRCTGKSGKLLLFIDSENVMIEDCLLID